MIIKPKHLAGHSKGCAVIQCSKEIPLEHQFCQGHYEKLTPEMRQRLGVLIQSARSGNTSRLNAMRDYVRFCLDHIATVPAR